MSDRASHSEEDRQAGLGGIFVEYPTREEVDHCIRDLPFEQRLTVLSQGFHRGAAPLHCYNLKEFVEAVSKREFNNPAGGVRSLDFDLVVPWLRDVIGDKELARAVQAIAKDAPRANPKQGTEACSQPGTRGGCVHVRAEHAQDRRNATTRERTSVP